MTNLALYQAEWCPYSHRVRQRLTELGLDFVARQVAADRDERSEMEAAVGTSSIPTLVADDTVIEGDEAILAYLDSRYTARDDAALHRAKARDEVPEFDEVASGERAP